MTPSTTRLMAVLPVVICAVTTLGAQGTAPRDSGDVAGARFRGTITASDWRHPGPPIVRPVSGVARWRIETDSMDWRDKLTIRVTLDAPERAVVVIRRAGVQLPEARAIGGGGGRPQHYVPEYVALMLPAHGSTALREQGGHYGDTAFVGAVPALTHASLVRGRLTVDGVPRRAGGAVTDGQQSARLAGTFAASFDPRRSPRPATMSASLQEAILRYALSDVTLLWMDNLMHLRAADSSHSEPLLRAYIEERWSHVATIESATTDFTNLAVRLRGKYAPVVCEATASSAHVSCTMSWLDRARSMWAGH